MYAKYKRKRVYAAPKYMALAKRRFVRRKRKINLERPVSDQPLSKIVQLKCSKLVELGDDSKSWHNVFLQCNDLYNPFDDTHANQPYGYTKLMEMYNYFTVLTCKVSLHCVDAAVYDNQMSFLTVVDKSGIPSTVYAGAGLHGLLEIPHRSTTLLWATGTAVERDRVIYQYIDCAKFFGKTRDELIADDTYAGQSATSPVRLVGCEIISISPYNVNMQPRTFLCEMDFLAYFHEPKNFVQST